jgi:hypothetical protein
VRELALRVRAHEHLVDRAQDLRLETRHPPPLDRRVGPPRRIRAVAGEALVHPRQEVVRVERRPHLLALRSEVLDVLRRVEMVEVDRRDAAGGDPPADLGQEPGREVLPHRVGRAREQRLRREPGRLPPRAARAEAGDLDREGLDCLDVGARGRVEREQRDRQLARQAGQDLIRPDLAAVVDRMGELLGDEQDPSGRRHPRSPSRSVGTGPRRR